MKRAPSDTLRITHRLPDRLSGLVNEFAQYGGLSSAHDIVLRRLTLQQEPDLEYRKIIDPEYRKIIDPEYRKIIDPDEVVTWVDISGTEEEVLATSWGNDLQAKACVRICEHLTW